MEPIDPLKNSSFSLPQRSVSHLIDDAARAILKESIPHAWVLRTGGEWDYGIDYFLEFTDSKNQVTGKSVAIQLKGKEQVSWNENGEVVVSGVKITTSNYWFSYQLPVFLVVADMGSRQSFYLPVKSFIRRNYSKYSLQEAFSYRVSRSFMLTPSDVSGLYRAFITEVQLNESDRLAVQFLSFQKEFFEYYHSWHGRYCNMEVENERMPKFFWFINNFRDYARVFDLNFSWSAHDEHEFMMWERGNSMTEGEMTSLLDRMDGVNTSLIAAVKQRVCVDESQYWNSCNPHVANALKDLLVEPISARSRRAHGLRW